MIHDKIKSAFCDVKAARLNGLIQFWAPTTTSGRVLLSTSHHPFAVEYLDPVLQKYRLCCLKYQYNVGNGDDDVTNNQAEIINSGPPATAFFNHIPEVVMDLKLHKGKSTLVDKALNLGFSGLILLPVFYDQNPSSSNSFCAGVVECCMKFSITLPVILNELKRALEV